jgi:cation diffusion facilitator CzcD-associated flavoprotein CzcO
LGFAKKYSLQKHCEFKKQISLTEWDNDKGQWEVGVIDLETGTMIHDLCHFLINASGILSAWKWPDVPGIDKFEGKMVHTANCDQSLDLTDKTVVLIGNGYVFSPSRHKNY